MQKKLTIPIDYEIRLEEVQKEIHDLEWCTMPQWAHLVSEWNVVVMRKVHLRKKEEFYKKTLSKEIVEYEQVTESA